MKSLLSLVVCVAASLVFANGGRPGPAWSGNALAGWTNNTCQCRSFTLKNGTLTVIPDGSDAQVYSPRFSLPASASQEFVFRARSTVAGVGEVFWIPKGAGGPAQKWAVRFDWYGDGAWHEYRIRPFWQGEKQIAGLRLDFPSTGKGSPFEISSISISNSVLPWLSADADSTCGVVFTAASDRPVTAIVRWTTTTKSGFQTSKIALADDGRRHTYYLNLGMSSLWSGTILLDSDIHSTSGAKIAAEDLRFVNAEPDLPPDLVAENVRMADAVNRAGASIPIQVMIHNRGTRTARDVSLTAAALPKGVTIENARALANLGEIPGLETMPCTVLLRCEKPCSATVPLILRAKNTESVRFSADVTATPPLGLPKADYVPEPRPVENDYDIGALYFPGWSKVSAWQRVWKVCPERKPILGWYDEANPEVVDWQIKWLRENGISWLLVDWYWHRGSQHLDHWINAFKRARYRRYLKWAVMWANHNGKGSHSEADQRAVTKFWIENYFNMPEYRRIDGKPVVMIWSPQNMENDVGPGGCRRLLEISREMAREAGYKGIWFICMKWPETDCSPATVQGYRDMGFDMTSIYHYMGHGGKAESDIRYDYKWLVASSGKHWRDQAKTGILPFLPNLATGWDDRPWNNQCEIYGKSPALFREICEEAKRFADESGVKSLCLAPLNEWGEGSYAEPNAEFGFGFYEAVRDTFCRKPAGGWPQNYAPKDVGLGPYDLPPPESLKAATSWSFTDNTAAGWSPLMGLDHFKVTPDGLSFTSTTRDPALTCSFRPVQSAAFKTVVLKMAVSGAGGSCQLFWAGPGTQISEAASHTLNVTADGAVHEYVFPVGRSMRWRGRINHFRLDPVSCPGAKVRLVSVSIK